MIGMSAGPIPWTAVQRYAEVEGMSVDETWTLHSVIRHLDQVLAVHQSSEIRKATKSKAPSKPRKSSGGGRR